MKASRAAVRQTKALARIEAKLDRVLALLGETPPAPEEDAAALDEIIEELSEEPAEDEPKGKKK